MLGYLIMCTHAFGHNSCFVFPCNARTDPTLKPHAMPDLHLSFLADLLDLLEA